LTVVAGKQSTPAEVSNCTYRSMIQGERVEKEIYSAGGLDFKIENLKCGIVQAGSAATRQESTVDSREK
jgi:hypothetical protein